MNKKLFFFLCIVFTCVISRPAYAREAEQCVYDSDCGIEWKCVRNECVPKVPPPTAAPTAKPPGPTSRPNPTSPPSPTVSCTYVTKTLPSGKKVTLCVYGTAECSGIVGSGGDPCWVDTLQKSDCNAAGMNRCLCAPNVLVGGKNDSSCTEICEAAGITCGGQNSCQSSPGIIPTQGVPPPNCQTECDEECRQASNCGGGTQGDQCGTDTKGNPKYDCRICRYNCYPAPTYTPYPPPPPTITLAPTTRPPTPIPTSIPTPTTNPTFCETMKSYRGSVDITTNLGSVKYGETVNFIATTNNSSQYVKSMTFQIIIKTGQMSSLQYKEIPATQVNGRWQSIYSYTFDTYGDHVIQVTSVNQIGQPSIPVPSVGLTKTPLGTPIVIKPTDFSKKMLTPRITGGFDELNSNINTQ